MDDLTQEFLAESNENLDRFEGDLVKLERDPGSKELLSGIFRGIHSIKGACGFLGFQKLEALAHAGENLLSKLRDGELELTKEIGSVLLETGDGIRQMLQAIGATGTDGENDFKELIARLKRLQEADLEVGPKASAGTKKSASKKAVTASPSAQEPERSKPPETSTHADQAPPTQAREPEPIPECALVTEAQREAYAASEVPTASQPTVRKASAAPPDEVRPTGATADSTIRVNVNLLDRLMNLVGELVLARNQIL